MSRSGYTDDCDDIGLWRGAVERALLGKRGQRFLGDLANALDAMPDKVLIADELIDANGDCCAIGAVCKARALDVTTIDYEDAGAVANAIGVARAMAAEIAYLNDEWSPNETPQERWIRMRKWVDTNLAKDAP